MQGSNPVRGEFSATVLTGLAAHQASYTIDTGSFPGLKLPGVMLTTQPYLAPKVKEEQSYTPTPFLLLRGRLQM